jgi:SNF2 family DNA or RNA helicase
LRLIFSDPDLILDKFLHRQWDEIAWQKLRLESLELQLDSYDEELLVLDQLKDRIRLLPHQIKTAMKVKNFMKCRAILADNVGLGKTIEAGIILKECFCRGVIEKVLILAPPSLTFQWKEELLYKFSEKFVVANTSDRDFQGLDLHDKLIVSLDLAKRGINSEYLKDVQWDMLIIDEAHRLKNNLSIAFNFVKELSSKYLLLLTATPLQNSLYELYNLVQLVRPDLLGTWREFSKDFVSDAKGRIVKDNIRLQNILSQIMIRTNRRETEGYLKFTKRIPCTLRIQPSYKERQLYQNVTRYVRRKYYEALKDTLANEVTIFSLLMFQRQLTSSSAAIIKALQNKLNTSSSSYDTFELSQLLNDALSIRNDTKLSRLINTVNQLDSKVLIFTTFLETQKQIARALSEHDIEALLFSGNMSYQKKEEAISRFKKDGRLLICTEAGSEGRNLQFCNVIVNYDLPWNPMRVEQRIGRIHRIGQEHDVYIYNFVTEDTVEDYIVNTLYDKIRLFELAIGNLDLILDDDGENYEKRIFEDYMQTVSTDDFENRLSILRDQTFKKKSVAEDILEFDKRVFENFDLSPLN